MTRTEVPCVTGCGLPSRYALATMDGSSGVRTACGRHVSHLLEQVTEKGPAHVTQIAKRKYR